MAVSIEPYNPDWKAAFEQLADYLQSGLDKITLDIQHVGSTSIPGVWSKPILDIDIVIHDKTLLQSIGLHLENLGYQAEGERGIPDRFAFKQVHNHVPHSRPQRYWPTHHLYICILGSLSLKNHLVFRDTLRANQELAEQYSLLKQQLVKIKGLSGLEYGIRKTDFICKVLAGAGFSEIELIKIKNANLQ